MENYKTMTTFFVTKNQEKGDYQNGIATDFSKKTEGNWEGEASQCRACQDSAWGEGATQKDSGSPQVHDGRLCSEILPWSVLSIPTQ